MFIGFAFRFRLLPPPFLPWLEGEGVLDLAGEEVVDVDFEGAADDFAFDDGGVDLFLELRAAADYLAPAAVCRRSIVAVFVLVSGD